MNTRIATKNSKVHEMMLDWVRTNSGSVEHVSTGMWLMWPTTYRPREVKFWAMTPPVSNVEHFKAFGVIHGDD